MLLSWYQPVVSFDYVEPTHKIVYGSDEWWLLLWWFLGDDDEWQIT